MVRKKLQSTNTTKSATPDRIHSKVYKEPNEELITLLMTIYNSLIQQKSNPKAWKLASVSLICKKGSKKPTNELLPCEPDHNGIQNHGFLRQGPYPQLYEKEWFTQQETVWLPQGQKHSSTTTESP